MRLIELMTSKGADIVKLNRGTLRDGAHADVTIIDPNREWSIDVEQFASKSRNCPYQGWTLKGRAIATIVNGEVKWEIAR